VPQGVAQDTSATGLLGLEFGGCHLPGLVLAFRKVHTHHDQKASSTELIKHGFHS